MFLSPRGYAGLGKWLFPMVEGLAPRKMVGLAPEGEPPLLLALGRLVVLACRLTTTRSGLKSKVSSVSTE